VPPAANGTWVSVDSIADGGAMVPVYNLRVADYHTYFVGTQTWGFSVWAHNSDPCLTPLAAVKAAVLPWFHDGARQAAKAIEAGQRTITVASRDEASELVWRMFSSRGFTNTTGRRGSDVRKLLGSKAGTYHWDDILDEAGRVAGHGANNPHGVLPHVQVHLETGDIVRIQFPILK
jgi:hypothetical protein